MTERPLTITTQIATPIQTAFNSAGSVSANDALTIIDVVEEEPYTIKCICDYLDDDGNTIYCEACDTWQHIECYYPGRVQDASKQEFIHSCVDCSPRQLDLDRIDATARQRDQRHIKANTESPDKKTKRPPSKSHKKKSKVTEIQVNGYHDRDGHSPQEHHQHAKKSKGHRHSHSVTSQMKRSPPYNARPSSHGLPPSPVHTPPDLPNYPEIHGYSDHFTTLYDDDAAVEINDSNKFANLGVTDTLAKWLQDPAKLLADVGIEDRHKIMPNVKKDVGNINWAPLRKEVTPISVPNSDRDLSCRSLITPRKFEKSDVVGELNGIVGFQIDLNDADKPPEGYAHSTPFVFYVPRLPLFIDTRREGSVCRYVRRSCRANTGLETYIDPRRGSQYHFWLVSERPIAANEQITIPWDFHFPKKFESRFLHFMNLSEEEGDRDQQPLTEEEYERLSGTINLVLSDYGGCACGLGSECAFARFHHNYHGRLQAQSNGAVKSKKGRKPKQNHVSPTSTGHATNSRAASEGHHEQYDDDDRRSISGSSRSKPNSRDLTPLHGVGESNNILTEVSGREKRKLALYEESFRKMDTQQSTKKKRASDGVATNLPPTTSKPRQKSVAPRQGLQSLNTNGSRKGHYVDASTSRRQSGSPSSAVSPNGVFPSVGGEVSRNGSLYRSRQASTDPKPIYSDSSTQTEIEGNAWYSPSSRSSAPKRPIIPLSKRLLNNRHRLRLDRQAQQGMLGEEDHSLATSPTMPMDLDAPSLEDRYLPGSPIDIRGRHGSIASSSPSIETTASVEVTMSDSPPTVIGTTIKPPPPPWPSNSPRTADLRIQMPPTPTFTVPILSGGILSSTTPSSATGSALQSPFGTNQFPGALGLLPTNTVNGLSQAPSPIKMKKKMSLSDYKLKNAKKTDSGATNRASSGSSPTMAPSVLIAALSTIDEAAVPGVLEGSTVIDSSMGEKGVGPVDMTGMPS